MTPRLQILVPALLLAAALLHPEAASAQPGAELLQSIQRGGGWVDIPIEGGAGGLRTDTVPTLGVTLAGCLTVWGGHSGEWTLEARDPVNGGRLDATASPGEGVPFTYRTGLQSVLDVRVRWSEPRDTVLRVWVGLGRATAGGRDPCTPTYGSP
jgi:hypothetical protein